MKTFRITFIVFLLHSTLCSLYSQIPTYTLTAKNFTAVAPNIMDFEIILVHTDDEEFEFCGSQHYFNFNPLISNGGTLSYTISPLDYVSDFNVNWRPRNPRVIGDSILGLSANALPGIGPGPLIPRDIPWKVIRVRLSTTSQSFANVSLNLKWRLTPLSNPISKLNAYIGTTNTEITNSSSYFIDTLFSNYVSCTIKFAPEGFFNNDIYKLRRKATGNCFLRNSTYPHEILDSSTALIDSITLNNTFRFNKTQTGNYYITVKFKNGIETWSAASVNLFNGVNNYDFTSSSYSAYGSNLVWKGVWCTYSGDVNYDNFIDLTDLTCIDNDLRNFLTGDVITDLNGDTVVDLDDATIADNNAKNYRGTIRP